MRVALVNYGGDFSARATPEQALGELRTLMSWAGALRRAGVDIRVFQGFHRDARVRLEGTDYQLVAGRFSPRLSRRRIPWRLHRAVKRWRPDIVHLNGLLYGAQARFLRGSLPTSSHLVLQHHGEQPDDGAVRHLQRWGLSSADAFFFTARDLATGWRQRGLIRASQPIIEILEGSSHLRALDPSTARATSGLEGRPIFLWAANLDSNKDPLTVLDGFETVLTDLPEARLYMAWRLESLLPEIRQRIASSPTLKSHVELLGTIPYADIEPLFNSADFLLQGSHRESCGFSITDAFACGTIPIVSDIPTFRVMTNDGEVGRLWPAGDANALRRAILTAVKQPRLSRQTVRSYFDKHLSFEAIGRRAVDTYADLQRGLNSTTL